MCGDHPNFELADELERCQNDRTRIVCLLDALGDGVLLVDQQGKVLMANRAMGGLLNRDHARLTSHTCCELLPHHSNTPDSCPARNFPGGQTGSFEVFFPEYRYFEEKVYPLFRAGQAPLYVIQVRDLTSLHMALQERKHFVHQLEETRRQLRRAEEEAASLRLQASRVESAAMPGRLLGLLFPEMWRTVRSLDEGLALLVGETDEGHQTGLDPVAVLRELVATSQRARSIVDKLSMLHLRDTVHPQVGVDSLVGEAVKEILPAAQTAQIPIEVHLGKAGAVEANPAQLREVLISLLWNAMDATRGTSGTISVTTGQVAEQAFIHVKDTGRGIPAAQRDRLFTPFFTTDPKGGKVGLGLVVCSHIIQAHGGSIDLDSEPGHGTLVRIRLPLRQSLTTTI